MRNLSHRETGVAHVAWQLATNHYKKVTDITEEWVWAAWSEQAWMATCDSRATEAEQA
jgi:hypothetical protein